MRSYQRFEESSGFAKAVMILSCTATVGAGVVAFARGQGRRGDWFWYYPESRLQYRSRLYFGRMCSG